MKKQSPIAVLSELHQKKFRESIEAAIIDKLGTAHAPTYHACIITNEGSYEALGKSKKQAKENAAKMALSDCYGIDLL